MKSSASLVRPLVRRLHPYVPGEQPKIKGLIKLNTNENPYPPSPKVLSAVKAAVDGRLRLYPNPTAQPLRERLAALHGCKPENVIVGNGSDELLALATRAFVEPAGAGRAARSTIQFFTPSYSLYPVLAEIHGASASAIPLNADFSLPGFSRRSKPRGWTPDAALTYVTTPHAPSGRAFSNQELDRLCRSLKGVVVLDEAYAEFANQTALNLALHHPNVLVSRTFSKAYSLCFQRIGYFIGPARLIDALDRIRDSYNVNGLGQAAALATLSDLPYYRRNFDRVIATRHRIENELSALGFGVLPSQTNFLLARPPRFPAKSWLEKLRAEKILVRWFNSPETRDFIRITIGTDADMNKFLAATRRILGAKRSAGPKRTPPTPVDDCPF